MPLTVDSGGGQYYMWDLHATAGNGISSPGVVTGGRANPSYKTHRARGVAYQQSFRPGPNVFAPRLKVEATKDTKPLLQNGIRGGSNLPFLKLQGGGPQQGWTHDNAKIHSMKFGFSGMESVLEVEFEFNSLLCTKTTGAVTQTALTGNTYTALDCVLLIGATDFGDIRFEAEVMNHLHTGPTAGSRTAGTLRNPQFLVEGPEEHKITVATLMPFSDTPIADYPAQAIGLVATFTDDAANTLVFTYTGLAHDEEFSDQEIVVDSEVRFTNTLIGRPGALVIT